MFLFCFISYMVACFFMLLHTQTTLKTLPTGTFHVLELVATPQYAYVPPLVYAYVIFFL